MLLEELEGGRAARARRRSRHAPQRRPPAAGPAERGAGAGHSGPRRSGRRARHAGRAAGARRARRPRPCDRRPRKPAPTALLADLERIRTAAARLGRAAAPRRGAAGAWRARGPEADARAPVSRGSRRAVILVVDDNDENRDMLARRLRRAGLPGPDGGRRARPRSTLLALAPVDLVLLDVMMPGLDGYAVLPAAQAPIPSAATSRSLMISALDEMDSVVRCIELGAEDYLRQAVRSRAAAGAHRRLPGEEAPARPGGAPRRASWPSGTRRSSSAWPSRSSSSSGSAG